MIPIGAFGGGSDHAAFAEASIPWAMLTTGAMDLKTAEEHALFGGTVGEADDPNYHGIGDDLGNIDATPLAIMTRA